jgi:hypothetical protein
MLRWCCSAVAHGRTTTAHVPRRPRSGHRPPPHTAGPSSRHVIPQNEAVKDCELPQQQQQNHPRSAAQQAALGTLCAHARPNISVGHNLLKLLSTTNVSHHFCSPTLLLPCWAPAAPGGPLHQVLSLLTPHLYCVSNGSSIISRIKSPSVTYLMRVVDCKQR